MLINKPYCKCFNNQMDKKQSPQQNISSQSQYVGGNANQQNPNRMSVPDFNKTDQGTKQMEKGGDFDIQQGQSNLEKDKDCKKKMGGPSNQPSSSSQNI